MIPVIPVKDQVLSDLTMLVKKYGLNEVLKASKFCAYNECESLNNFTPSEYEDWDDEVYLVSFSRGTAWGEDFYVYAEHEEQAIERCLAYCQQHKKYSSCYYYDEELSEDEKECEDRFTYIDPTLEDSNSYPAYIYSDFIVRKISL